jgi:hypothetical protein
MRPKFSFFLPLVIIILLGSVGYLIYQNVQLKKSRVVPCGGWDTFGKVVCECNGQVEKFVCPPNTACDSGTDTCSGNCGECKCYQGSVKDGIEIPCNGKDERFK